MGRPTVILVSLATLLGCGGRTDLALGDPVDAGAFDAGRPIPSEECSGDAPRSPPCGAEVRHGTRASCAIELLDCGRPLEGEAIQPGTCELGEAFLRNPPYCDEAEVVGRRYRVLALDRLGAGRVAAFCDGTTAGALFRRTPLAALLGSTDAPRIALVGEEFPCNVRSGDSHIEGTLLGATIPARYATGADLAEDFDVLVVCQNLAELPALRRTLTLGEALAERHGGGLLVVRDYGLGETDAAQLELINALMARAGFRFDARVLGAADATVALPCPE